MQYWSCERRHRLFQSFTYPIQSSGSDHPATHQIATLDDFGPGATFDALNTFSSTEMKRGVHRTFVDTLIPFKIHNFGFGFAHYALPPLDDETPR